MDSHNVKYKSSPIQVQAIIFGQLYTFFIDTGSTNSSISPSLVFDYKDNNKLQDPWNLQMVDGAKKWINQKI